MEGEKEINLIELNEFEKRNLICLIANQDMKQIRNLPIHTYDLNYLVEDSDIQFDQKISPLLSASYIGKIETILMILDNEGVDIDLESYPECYTPLMVACFKGFYEIVRLLLEKQADVNKINRLGQKPILFCFSRLEELNYKYENQKICMMLLELLLTKGADINIRIEEKQGYTILMKLASLEINKKEKLSNSCNIIKFLIERGADPKVIGYNNKSVYDVIHQKTEENLKEELIYTIKNTKQIIFYNKIINNDITNTNSSLIERTCNTNLNRSKSIFNALNIEEGSCVLVHEVEDHKLNCCIICNLLF